MILSPSHSNAIAAIRTKLLKECGIDLKDKRHARNSYENLVRLSWAIGFPVPELTDCEATWNTWLFSLALVVFPVPGEESEVGEIDLKAAMDSAPPVRIVDSVLDALVAAAELIKESEGQKEADIINLIDYQDRTKH